MQGRWLGTKEECIRNRQRPCDPRRLADPRATHNSSPAHHNTPTDDYEKGGVASISDQHHTGLDLDHLASLCYTSLVSCSQ